MTILITRPEPDGQRLADDLTGRGHKVLLSPALAVEPLAADLSDIETAQALIFTSLNGVRHAKERIESRTLPVFAVGYRTAATAREAGWDKVISADGDAVMLADLIAKSLKPEDGPLVHLCGRDHKAILKHRLEKAGFTILSRPVYAAKPVADMHAAAKKALLGGDISLVLLYSPRSARQFRAQCRTSKVDHMLSHATAGCLSPAVADAAGEGWRQKIVAQTPDEKALFAALDTYYGEGFSGP